MFERACGSLRNASRICTPILQKINVYFVVHPYTQAMTTLDRWLPLIGRLLFAFIFLTAAPRHFTAEGISHAADLGVPLANIFVPLSGILAIVGALSVILGFHAKWGAWMLVLFLVPVTLGMHQFWKIADAEHRHIQVAMFAKNISMLGGALLLARHGSGAFSLRD
jgi:putative oxidoreductase